MYLAIPNNGPSDRYGEVQGNRMKVWECKLVLSDEAELPDGADFPMRQALRIACEEMTGQLPIDIFSGWAGSLTEIEKKVMRTRA